VEMIVQKKLLAVRRTFKFFSGNSTGEPDDAGLLGELKKKRISFKPLTGSKRRKAHACLK